MWRLTWTLLQKMESNYKGHYKPRNRDWMTQMTAFGDLMKHAAPAKEKVLSLHKEVRNTTAAALVTVPGFNASALTSTDDGSNRSMRPVAEETITHHKPI